MCIIKLKHRIFDSKKNTTKIFKLESSSNPITMDKIRREEIRIKMLKKGYIDPELIL